MACVSHRRHTAAGPLKACRPGSGCSGSWVLDWYHTGTGKRKWKSYPFTDEGLEDATAECLRLRKRKRTGMLEPDDRLRWGAYAARWLRAGTWPDSTRTVYRDTLRLYFGMFDDRALLSVTRDVLKAHLVEMRARYAMATARRMLATVRGMLGQAVDDGVLASNPAVGLAKPLKLKRARGDRGKAIPAGDWRAFLQALRALAPERALPLYVMGFTGLRVGEVKGIRVTDIDWKAGEAGVIRIVRQVHGNGRVAAPKGGRERDVDMAELLRDTIRAMIRRRAEEALARGTPDGLWLLYPKWGEAPSANEARRARHYIQRAMARACKRAGIGHYTPHSLRHTYATLILGTDPDEKLLLYVSRQLGHATLGMTADLYAASARPKAPGVVDRLSAIGGVVQAQIDFEPTVVPMKKRSS